MKWVAIAGFEGQYEVSECGSVRSVTRVHVDGSDTACAGRRRTYPGKLIKGFANPRGYIYVSLAGRNIGVHRIVLMTFGPPSPGPDHVVHHLDGNKQNNAIPNLAWVTHTENNRHARKTRLNRAHGERCNFTVFSDKTIDAIRLLWPTNRFTLGELAELFGMSYGHVGEIVAEATRKRPTDPPACEPD